MLALGQAIQAKNNRRWVTVGNISYQDDTVTIISNFKSKVNLRLKTAYVDTLLLDGLIRYKNLMQMHNGNRRMKLKDTSQVYRIINSAPVFFGNIVAEQGGILFLKEHFGKLRCLSIADFDRMMQTGIIQTA